MAKFSKAVLEKKWTKEEHEDNIKKVKELLEKIRVAHKNISLVEIDPQLKKEYFDAKDNWLLSCGSEDKCSRSINKLYKDLAPISDDYGYYPNGATAAYYF